MNDRKQNILWVGVATLIFAVLLWTADLNLFLEKISQARPSYIGIALLAGFGVLLSWTANWYNFFKVSNINCSFRKTFQMMSAGQFLNAVTPLGQFGGQPFMAYMISSNSKTSYEKSLATVMSADLLAIIPLSTFVLSGYLYTVFSGSSSSQIAGMTAVTASLLLFGIVMGYIGWYRPGTLENSVLVVFEKITSFIGRGSHLVDKLESRLENIEDTFETVGNNPKAILRALAITHTAFLFKMAAFYAVVMSLGLSINPFYVMLIIPIASTANFSPTPGGTGTFEAVMAQLTMIFMGVSFEIGLAIGILHRVATYWLHIVVGYIGMSTLNISTNSMEKIPE
ncbi:MAG: hypothetical protein ACI83Q_000855 [Colwellia polaris]|jgi:uncharacterized protein (TIRG00374 family)